MVFLRAKGRPPEDADWSAESGEVGTGGGTGSMGEKVTACWAFGRRLFDTDVL